MEMMMMMLMLMRLAALYSLKLLLMELSNCTARISLLLHTLPDTPVCSASHPMPPVNIVNKQHDSCSARRRRR